MTRVTLDIKNLKDLKLIRDLARRLKIPMREVYAEAPDSDASTKEPEPADWIARIAEAGDLKEQIQDPLKWQNEQRKDRTIHTREE